MKYHLVVQKNTSLKSADETCCTRFEEKLDLLNFFKMKMYLGILYLVAFSQFVVGNDYGSDTIISDSGLLFKKTSDIIITGDSWTIILSLNVTQHLNAAMKLKRKIEELQKFSDIDKLEVNRLLRVADQLVEVTEAMTGVLPQYKRIKRSLIDFLGMMIVSSIFDSDSNPEEIEQIKDTLERLENEQASQKQLIDEQITFTNSLNEKVENNLVRITNLAEAITDELIRIDAQFKDVEDNFKIIEERIKNLKETTSLLRILQVESLHSLIMANRLQHAIEMAGEGKLSFYLLPPKEFQKELIKISSLLPAGSKLLRGLSVEDMYKYREMAKVVVMASSQQIFLAIRLPLITIETSFTAYSVNAMPVFTEELEHAVKVVPESKYLVVSNDRQHYGLADSDYFKKCSGEKPMICPADIVLLSRYIPTCVGASYFGDTTQIGLSCNKKLIINGEEFAWFEDKQNKGWIYSLNKKTTLTMMCHDKMASIMKLNKGIGYLSNTSHCRIISDNFKLLRASASGSSLKHGNDTFLLKPFHQIQSPFIFSTDERSKLSDIDKISLAIDKIKEKKRIEKVSSKSIEVPIDDLFSDIEVHYNCLEDFDSQGYLLGFSTIALIAICVVVSMVTTVITNSLFMYFRSKRLNASTNSRVSAPYNTEPEPLYANQNPFLQKPLLNFNNTSLID
ncbi:hypothetical protein O3M35_007736 [Rhynocoris fuscipes]|uniref:Envelope protein n=1 Tax=Rhynocoris fuscipes TaxID=488301 RepID=A0AAW1DBV0_9HEMI